MLIKYKIKQEIVTSPEIELPEGSLAVSIKHHGAYKFTDGTKFPETWQVIWLEPIEVKHSHQNT